MERLPHTFLLVEEESQEEFVTWINCSHPDPGYIFLKKMSVFISLLLMSGLKETYPNKIKFILNVYGDTDTRLCSLPKI